MAGFAISQSTDNSEGRIICGIASGVLSLCGIALTVMLGRSLYNFYTTNSAIVQRLGIFARINDPSLHVIQEINQLSVEEDEKATDTVAIDIVDNDDQDHEEDQNRYVRLDK